MQQEYLLCSAKVCLAGLALPWGWFPRDKGKIDEAKWWELACDPALLALVSEEGWLAWHDENYAHMFTRHSAISPIRVCERT